MHRRSLFGDTRNEPFELDEPPEPLMDTPASPALAAHTTPIAQPQQQAQRRILTVEEFMRAPQRYQNCLFKSEDIVDFYHLMQLTLPKPTCERVLFLNAINDLFKKLTDEEKMTFLSKLNTKETPLAITNQFIQWPLLDSLIKKVEATQPYAMRVQIQNKCADPKFNKRRLLYLLGSLITYPKEPSIANLEIIQLLNPDIQRMRLYERIDLNLAELALYYQARLFNNLREAVCNRDYQNPIAYIIQSFKKLFEHFTDSSDLSICMIMVGEAFSRHNIKINVTHFDRFIDTLKEIFYSDRYRKFQELISTRQLSFAKQVQYKLTCFREPVFDLYDLVVISSHYVDYFLAPRSDEELAVFEQLSDKEKSTFFNNLKDQLINKTISLTKIEGAIALIGHIKRRDLGYSQSCVENFIEALIDFRDGLTENANENILVNAFLEQYETEYNSPLMTP